jgi:hypothetical protein
MTDAMKSLLPLVGALIVAAAPAASSAQSPGAYWRGDICHQQKPAAGAAAGPAIGASSVTCLPYPPRVVAHESNCRWVTQDLGGAPQGFEVCKDRDGVWRPSGRS